MEQSRTEKVAKNATISLLCQCVAMAVQFIGRRIFIEALGKDYLGVNGLFTNVLTILAFAELGIGSAMVFSMYKPLVQKDTEKLKSLMLLYKRAYRTIGIVVAVCGVCVIPFLNVIIREKPAISDSLVLIYLLYLFNSVCSYFFVYKKSIISADQKLYIVNIYYEIANILKVVLQSIFLFLTHNFIVYLAIQIAVTLFNNIWTAYKADKMYPFLREPAKPLPREESRGIFRNVRALAVYKFGSVVLNGTDNIIISKMFTLGDVGLVSNYNMISTLFTTFLGRITESFTASIGNLNTGSDEKHQHWVFRKLFFLCAWMFGLASVGMYIFTNDVIALWLGSTDYVLPPMVVTALVVSFYVSSVQYAAYSYRTTLGLFVQGQIAPVIAAVVNIVTSILLGKWIGLSGIFFATAISRFGAISVIDGVLVYRKRFKCNPAQYFARYFGLAALVAALAVALQFVVGRIPLYGWIGLVVKIIVVVVLYNLAFFAIFGRTRLFRELMNSIGGVISRLLRKVLKRRPKESAK